MPVHQRYLPPTLRRIVFAGVILLAAFIVYLGVLRLSQGRFPVWVGLDHYVDVTGEYHPGVTLWDWLQLLILPIVVSVAIYVFHRESTLDRQAALEREAGERRAAAEQRQDVLLREYFDRIIALVVKEGLRLSQPDAGVRAIAWAAACATDGLKSASLSTCLLYTSPSPRD